MVINKTFFSSLRWKIAFTYLIVIGVGFIVINLSIMEIIQKNMIDGKKIAFQKYAVEVAESISEDFFHWAENYYKVYEIDALAKEIAAKEGQPTRILVLDNNGIVEYDTSNRLLKHNLRKHFSEIDAVLKGGVIEPIKVDITTGDYTEKKWLMYSFAPIVHPVGGTIGMVMISTSLEGIRGLLNEVRWRMNLSSVVISVSVITISFVFAGYITRPIKELTKVIEKMSQGHLEQRVQFKTSGEIKQLAEAFNTMAEKLENLDRARNEFVSNASHELKTPLSAIKVLTESLLHMGLEVPDIYTEFLTDINNEIDRLNAIITDLLTLVHIDQANTQLKREKIDLNELVKKSIKGLQLLAEKKNINMETTYEDKELTIYGDSSKLQQVITNIVDNAIKYTPEGGRVSIEVYEGHNKAMIKVSDTGVGIPQEDIPHIFDRFFRVDKARSRATGGTGLGLAIAHRIVLLHDGNIHVTSREGKGTSFYIELPFEPNTQ